MKIVHCVREALRRPYVAGKPLGPTRCGGCGEVVQVNAVSKGEADGDPLDEAVKHFGPELRQRAERARGAGRVSADAGCTGAWAELYQQMADDDEHGIAGTIVNRAEAHRLRPALTYALLDGARAIDREHVHAAWAVWKYARASAAYLFEHDRPDDDLDLLWSQVRSKGAAGMTRREMHKVFKGHRTAKVVNSLVEQMEGKYGALTEEVKTGGRSKLVTRDPRFQS